MIHRIHRRRCFLPMFSIACLAVTMVVAQDVPATATTAQQPAAKSSPDPSSANAPPKTAGQYVEGTVFVDNNGDGKLDSNDMAFAGAKVSNGVDIVLTDSRGKYQLPLKDDSVIFVIKPRGFRTPLDENNLPKFYYIHKPNGSPQLRFPGSKKTGPIPRSVDFPLYPQSEPEQFKIIMFGDPQPRNKTEVNYIARDVVDPLIGSDAAFGVTLGDIVFDDLSLFEPLNKHIALIGIPWYNVIGNHDINLDAKSRKHVNETFEATFGPSYFSFDYGQVHFVVMDNIDWVNTPQSRGRYFANFGKRQLDFLEKDLEMIPENQMVVLLMHVPLPTTDDRAKLFRLIENRPLCVSVSGHTHYHKHVFLKESDGWKGKTPHHHIINVTVSGSWWGGQKDIRGIPHTTMSDGAPNGYSELTFDGDNYRLNFFEAGGSAAQMRIHTQDEVTANELGETKIWVNVFNGSEESKVEMSVKGQPQTTKLEKTVTADPAYAAMVARELKLTPPIQPKMAKPTPSGHLWVGPLPTELKPGVHLIEIKTTDRHGRIYRAVKSLRVVDN